MVYIAPSLGTGSSPSALPTFVHLLPLWSLPEME